MPIFSNRVNAFATKAWGDPGQKFQEGSDPFLKRVCKMNHRLIMVEGIPGSGKTTIAKKVAAWLNQHNLKATCYNESDYHPADLSWIAVLSKQNWQELLETWPSYEDSIRAQAWQEGEQFFVAYSNIELRQKSDEKLYHWFSAYEVYDGKWSLDRFTEIHIRRWQRFGKEAMLSSDISVFECAWLQNHVNELLMFHNKKPLEMIEHLKALWKTVEPLNPLVLYLQPDNVTASIERVSVVRVNKNGDPVWRDRVIEVVCQSPYGRAHELEGLEGMTEYFRVRNQIELEMLEQLPHQGHVITRHEQDWETLWNEVEKVLETAFLNER